MSAHSPKVEIINGVSTADEPSAAWGWHGMPKKVLVVTGTLSGLALLAMLVGNHHGNVENIWLITLAVAIFLGVALYAIRPQGTTRTTVTAHNKPVGHQEPDWIADQKNLTGVYATLTTAELRAAFNKDYEGVDGPQEFAPPALKH